MLQPPSPVSLFLFFVILVGIIGTVSIGVYRGALQAYGRTSARRSVRRFLIVLLLWLLLVSVFVASGLLKKSPMLAIPIFTLTMISAAALFALSSTGALLARELPLPALIAFQAFR